MKAIAIVLSAFGTCLAFVLFFAAFTQIPLLLLGVFLLYAANSGRKRRRPSAATGSVTGPLADQAVLEDHHE
jgi:hypothetical protein